MSLHALARHGKTKDLISSLAASTRKIDAPDDEGLSPLHHACLHVHTEAAVALIDHGADLNVRTNNDDTPLHLSCYEGLEEMSNLLLSKGADVNAINIHEVTPLHNASKKGNERIVVKVLESGADVDRKDGSGYSPLHLCAQEGHLNVGKLLLDKRCEVDALSRYKRTPLHEACKLGLGGLQVALLLVKNGADLFTNDASDKCPLDYCDREEMRQQLMDAFSKLEAPMDAKAIEKAFNGNTSDGSSNCSTVTLEAGDFKSPLPPAPQYVSKKKAGDSGKSSNSPLETSAPLTSMASPPMWEVSPQRKEKDRLDAISQVNGSRSGSFTPPLPPSDVISPRKNPGKESRSMETPQAESLSLQGEVKTTASGSVSSNGSSSIMGPSTGHNALPPAGVSSSAKTSKVRSEMRKMKDAAFSQKLPRQTSGELQSPPTTHVKSWSTKSATASDRKGESDQDMLSAQAASRSEESTESKKCREQSKDPEVQKKGCSDSIAAPPTDKQDAPPVKKSESKVCTPKMIPALPMVLSTPGADELSTTPRTQARRGTANIVSPRVSLHNSPNTSFKSKPNDTSGSANALACIDACGEDMLEESLEDSCASLSSSSVASSADVVGQHTGPSNALLSPSLNGLSQIQPPPQPSYTSKEVGNIEKPSRAAERAVPTAKIAPVKDPLQNSMPILRNAKSQSPAPNLRSTIPQISPRGNMMNGGEAGGDMLGSQGGKAPSSSAMPSLLVSSTGKNRGMLEGQAMSSLSPREARGSLHKVPVTMMSLTSDSESVSSNKIAGTSMKKSPTLVTPSSPSSASASASPSRPASSDSDSPLTSVNAAGNGHTSPRPGPRDSVLGMQRGLSGKLAPVGVGAGALSSAGMPVSVSPLTPRDHSPAPSHSTPLSPKGDIAGPRGTDSCKMPRSARRNSARLDKLDGSKPENKLDCAGGPSFGTGGPSFALSNPVQVPTTQGIVSPLAPLSPAPLSPLERSPRPKPKLQEMKR